MTKEELGQRIKDRRELMGMSQQRLSEYSGVSVVTISQIEGGKANPAFETLEAIFHFLSLEMKVEVNMNP